MSIRSLKKKYFGKDKYEYSGYSGGSAKPVIDEYSTYIVKFFRAVPENAKLICRNRFTGKISVKDSGFRLTMPWIESKFVSMANRTIDYPKEKYKTIDGLELEIDVAITVAITDPTKYELNNLDPFKELGIITRDILRVFIANNHEDQLVKTKHTMNDFDVADAYDRFEEKYGIKVKNVYFKTIELPQSLKDDYEKKLVQERENERAMAELTARRARAEIEAQITKISMKADTDAMKTRIQAYINAIDENKNLTIQEKKQLLETLLLTMSNANIVTSLNGGISQNDMMNYLMSQSQQEQGRTRRRVRISGKAQTQNNNTNNE